MRGVEGRGRVGRRGEVQGGGPMLRPVVMCLAETQSDGPPGKSIPGILQEQQQNLGPGRLLGSLLNTQPEPYFSASVSRKLSLCFGRGDRKCLRLR